MSCQRECWAGKEKYLVMDGQTNQPIEKRLTTRMSDDCTAHSDHTAHFAHSSWIRCDVLNARSLDIFAQGSVEIYEHVLTLKMRLLWIIKIVVVTRNTSSPLSASFV